jgi:hemerythrin superfamily protein
MTDLARKTSPQHGLRILMPSHHAAIDAACTKLLETAYSDLPRDLVERWHEAELELLDHMAAEEELILPAYQHADPEDAQELRDDHARLRELLVEIAVATELHEVRIATLRRLVELLRAHAAREDATLYPWAQRHLPRVAMQELMERLRRWRL